MVVWMVVRMCVCLSVVCLSIYVSIYLFACLPACLPACRSRFLRIIQSRFIHTCASPLSAISDFVIAALNSLRSPLTNADKQKFAEAFLKYAMDVLERCVALSRALGATVYFGVCNPTPTLVAIISTHDVGQRSPDGCRAGRRSDAGSGSRSLWPLQRLPVVPPDRHGLAS